MKWKCRAGAASILLSVLASASSAQSPSVQQQFEAASAHLSAERWQDALNGFAALEAQLDGSQHARSRAIVQVRKGEALRRLDRNAEAAAALSAGLAALPTNDPSLKEDRLLAHVALGQLDQRLNYYASALVHFREALALADEPAMRLRALRGLIDINTIFDPHAAERDAYRALQLVRSEASSNRPLLALHEMLWGRALLNAGRTAESLEPLRAAVEKLGGLTLEVDQLDVMARSDVAIAAMIADRPNEARKYLAYTGAGRLKNVFPLPTQQASPSCADVPGFAPEDVVIVQFAVRDDGTVTNAIPIYSSKQGSTAALAFTNSAELWRWDPEQIAQISPLMRMFTRVQMHCTRTALTSPYGIWRDTDLAAWLGTRGIRLSAATDTPAAYREQLQLLREPDSEGSREPLELLPVLISAAESARSPIPQALRYYRRAIAIARANDAPPSVQNFLEFRVPYLEHLYAGRHADSAPFDFATILASEAVKSDPRSRTLLTYYQALRGDKDELRSLLTKVLNAPATASSPILKTAAASLLVNRTPDMPDLTRQYVSAANLQNPYCWAVGEDDRRSIPTKYQFPDEAQRWGFEGWVASHVNVRADGSVGAVEPLAAYPPFVFVPAASRILKRSRFGRGFDCKRLTRITFDLKG